MEWIIDKSEQEKKIEEDANYVLELFDDDFCYAAIEATLLRAIELAKYRCMNIKKVS